MRTGVRASPILSCSLCCANTIGAAIRTPLIGEARQLLVSCGGGRRLADGLRKQHVRTIRLLVWDTLEDFFAIGTSYVGRRQHATRTYMDEG